LLEGEQKEEVDYLLKLTPKMIKFKSLKKNKQFLNILKKKKINTKYFIIYFDKTSTNTEKSSHKYLNISFVMKKKIGNAVKRNKIKRKLKSAVQEILNNNIIDLNYTYIIFGKNNVYKDKFKLVVDEVNKIFNKINKYA
tara:strand:- start:3294 stop:3710 length:417 start_codon:yes stop_codon:yes gene_type:complete